MGHFDNQGGEEMDSKQDSGAAQVEHWKPETDKLIYEHVKEAPQQ